MDFFKALEIFIIALYFIGSVVFLAGMLGRKNALKKTAEFSALLGFALHTLYLGLYLGAHRIEALVHGNLYFNLLGWVFMLIFFLLWWKHKLEFLALIASPLALLLFLSSLSTTALKVKMPDALSGLFFGLHIALIFLSLAFLAMAFGAGLIFLHLEKKIKTKAKLTGFRKDLPALSTFDAANYWSVVAGFPLFTVGILSGFIWAKITWGRLISWDPKEIVSVFIWLCYAFLFHQRLALGWRGRKPAGMAILVFVLSVLSLVIVNFLTKSHHSFQP
ncbi:MAG: cytochrome c biogenesis protein CcsA [Thermodesulfobacteriota bacterium]|nr:cytochrome c biogenesis protein CcsA [Thermodesulfobacteriota bacterium]